MAKEGSPTFAIGGLSAFSVPGRVTPEADLRTAAGCEHPAEPCDKASAPGGAIPKA